LIALSTFSLVITSGEISRPICFFERGALQWPVRRKTVQAERGKAMWSRPYSSTALLIH
jgi:hypothetical protein